MVDELKRNIINRQTKICVIGLGYVGLPLALEFAKEGFEVMGLEVDEDKVRKVNRGVSYILDVSGKDLKNQIKEKRFKATSKSDILQKADIIIVCVPTPLRKTKEPDISYIIEATEKVSHYLRKGQIIILESTTYPGTTDELILPMLEKKGFKVGKDIFLAFSPERIDPGNPQFNTKNIPKVVGGIDAESTDLVYTLYHQIVNEVIAVSSAKVAEMVKLLENTFRAVNIGLINEIALLCDRLGIDVWEVISAAKTKPFGFMAFYPGPGIGGHCIPYDPLYLSWKARSHGFEARFIELAHQINTYMPHYIIEKTISALNEQAKPLKNARILVIGITYKRDVVDTRESPALEIIKLLEEKKAIVSYHDPYISQIQIEDKIYNSLSLEEGVLRETDCVIIVTDHLCLDYSLIVKEAKLIIDTRNALSFYKDNKKIIRI
ncbi:MAG: nucleotide sugar dehydrogenase [Candidatus Omnitrophica bacterium]|nr:nucleotide sugar dehydrogenase [Candidatus Omnitrophota bacterium]